MSIIQSRHEVHIAAPNSVTTAIDAEVWLASMSDSGWRVLTDFRNWSDWIPGIQSVEKLDSEPPARGTALRVDTGYSMVNCSIDRWDPPRSLHFSVAQGTGEIAYGFLIDTSSKNKEVHVSLEMERSLSGLYRFAGFFLEWRLRKLGQQLLSNLAARIRTAKN